MKFLKSYRGAVLVTALIVLLSATMGCWRSVSAERGQVLKIYEQGVNGDGHSAGNDMHRLIATAKNLRAVAEKYAAVSGEVSALDGAVSWAESNDSPDTGAFPAPVQNLCDHCDAVISALRAGELSEKDAGYLKGFEAELAAIQDRMRRDGYNDAARIFNEEVLGTFPGTLLLHLRAVLPLATFS